MDKLKGFVAVGVNEDGEISVYTFRHWNDAIDFINAARHVADIGWEVHEFNFLGGVAAAISDLQQSLPEE